MSIMTCNEFYPAIKDLLGLPDHLVSFEIRVCAGQIIAVQCEYYLDGDAVSMGKLSAVLADYELVRRPSAAIAESESGPANFDSWMRNRTDAAHAAYMARHSAGGIEYRQAA